MPTDFRASPWRDCFDTLHSAEKPGVGGASLDVYLAQNWELFDLPNLFARKVYRGTKTEGVNQYSEDLEMTLKHTPDPSP